jgi:caffeoyl-CoA O-methyltransferase
MSIFEESIPLLDPYLNQNASDEPLLLQQLRRETYLKTTQPHMLSGHSQGRFLSMMAKIIRPKSILEIGTFTGYATLCLAEGLAPGGKIITLDKNEELGYLPQKYFALSAQASQIEFVLEDAHQWLQNSQEDFDLVFIDADKSGYLAYWELIKTRLKPGGVVLIDNMLWYGKVYEEAQDKITQQLRDLNLMIAQDPDFDNVIVPLRDGIHLIRKK